MQESPSAGEALRVVPRRSASPGAAPDFWIRSANAYTQMRGGLPPIVQLERTAPLERSGPQQRPQ
jgi:hypothetical protein